MTDWNAKISGYLDDELDARERAAFESELERSPELRAELDAIRATKEVTGGMRLTAFPDQAWERYWRDTYNRLERRAGWILLSGGTSILLGYAAFEIVTALIGDTTAPAWVRAGIALAALGGAVLFVSVLRERLAVRRADPYREVRR